MASSVRLERVTKRFAPGAAPAVDGVSLEARAGEFLVLVGPSGCGKTTVLRLVAGLEMPDEGRIHIGERDVTGLSPGDRDLAMVFQTYALYPHLTVAENIGFGLRLRKVGAGDAARRARAAAEMLGIAALMDRRPAQLSGGQRQRVALARAIVREPHAFLFDEPLSNLDAQVRAETRAELITLHRRLGATMLYVTHDQVEAMTMAERVAVMREGRVEQLAPPLELYRAPATLFVAGFIGAPAINRFPGRVVAGEGGARFVGAVEVPVRAAPQDDVTLGVRAEGLRLAPPGGGAAAEIRTVEPLGPETHVRVRLADGTEAVVRVAAGAPHRPGEHVAVHVDPGQALLFGADGRRIAE